MNTQTPSSNPSTSNNPNPASNRQRKQNHVPKIQPEGQNIPIDLSSSPTVMVKFTVTSPSHVPPAIAAVTKMDEKIRTYHRERYAAAKGQPQLAIKGRHRPGVQDTGEPNMKNLYMVRPEILRKGLANEGYYVSSAYFYMKDWEHGKFKYTIVVVFAKTGSGEPAFDFGDPENAGVEEAIRSLAKTTWGFFHGWFNRLENTTTLNFLHFHGEESPKYSLVVRGGVRGKRKVMAILVNNGQVAESDENVVV